MLEMKKYIYLGVDQTGAIDSKGKPRPLPACLIQNDVISFFYLSTFSKQEILNKVQPAPDEQLLICIDCVLGLPDQLKLTWRSQLKKLRKNNTYGRQAAIVFFRNIGKGQILRRKIEIANNANSVFTEKPYQKNIQTGTFRIWKDISWNENDFFVPALEKRTSPGQIAIFEGYPSLSWRLLFKSTTRQPKKLSEFIKDKKLAIQWNKKHQASVMKDANLADAFVLALKMKTFKKMALLMIPTNEGWILGNGKDLMSLPPDQ